MRSGHRPIVVQSPQVCHNRQPRRTAPRAPLRIAGYASSPLTVKRVVRTTRIVCVAMDAGWIADGLTATSALHAVLGAGLRPAEDAGLNGDRSAAVVAQHHGRRRAGRRNLQRHRRDPRPLRGSPQGQDNRQRYGRSGVGRGIAHTRAGRVSAPTALPWFAPCPASWNGTPAIGFSPNVMSSPAVIAPVPSTFLVPKSDVSVAVVATWVRIVIRTSELSMVAVCAGDAVADGTVTPKAAARASCVVCLKIWWQ